MDWGVVVGAAVGGAGVVLGQVLTSRSNLTSLREEHRNQRAVVEHQEMRQAVIGYLAAAEAALAVARGALVSGRSARGTNEVAGEVARLQAAVEFWIPEDTVKQMTPYFEAVASNFSVAVAPDPQSRAVAIDHLREKGWDDPSNVDQLRRSFIDLARKEMREP